MAAAALDLDRHRAPVRQKDVEVPAAVVPLAVDHVGSAEPLLGVLHECLHRALLYVAVLHERSVVIACRRSLVRMGRSTLIAARRALLAHGRLVRGVMALV